MVRYGKLGEYAEEKLVGEEAAEIDVGIGIATGWLCMFDEEKEFRGILTFFFLRVCSDFNF